MIGFFRRAVKKPPLVAGLGGILVFLSVMGLRFEGGLEFPEEETKEDLLGKFVNNASRRLSADKTNKIVQTVLDLEKLENVAELMQISSQ